MLTHFVCDLYAQGEDTKEQYHTWVDEKTDKKEEFVCDDDFLNDK